MRMRKRIWSAKDYVLATAIAMLDGINENEVNENGKVMGELIYELECFLPVGENKYDIQHKRGTET